MYVLGLASEWSVLVQIRTDDRKYSCFGRLEGNILMADRAKRLLLLLLPSQVAHAPGLELTRALLSPPFNAGGWANRVFFSDDGSTAVS